MDLTGKIGHVDELRDFYAMLPTPSNNTPVFIKGCLLYGKALIENNLFSLAGDVYRDLQSRLELTIDEKREVNDGLFEIIQGEKHFFEAEQVLRLRLIHDNAPQKTLYQLIETSLQNKDWDNAWKWYECLVAHSKGLVSPRNSGYRDLFFLKSNI